MKLLSMSRTFVTKLKAGFYAVAKQYLQLLCRQSIVVRVQLNKTLHRNTKGSSSYADVDISSIVLLNAVSRCAADVFGVQSTAAHAHASCDTPTW